MLALMKTLEGRWFDGVNKQWVAKNTSQNVLYLINNSFVSTSSEPLLVPVRAVPPITPTPQAPINEVLLPKGIRDYQRIGVQFLEARNGNGIVADAPRLGKSLQALGYCMQHPDQTKHLIICPSNVKIVWRDEVEKWLHEKAVILDSRTPYDLRDTPSKFFIINYDILADWHPSLMKIKSDVIICDEFHYLGNTTRYDPKEHKKVTVQRNGAFRSLAKKSPHNILLSGTPLRSNPLQFYVPLHVVAPEVFPQQWGYKQEFCGPKMTNYGWSFSGASNIELLYSLVSPYMIRRRKEDVIKDLPLKQRIIVAMENRADPVKELQDKISWIRDYLEEEAKLVVFAWNRDVCEAVYQSFKKEAVLIYGGITATKRDQLKKSFMNDPKIKLYVGQVISSNVGIDLSVSDTVVFVQLPFNPGDAEQAEERVFLPGDGKERITIYYLITAGTKEEDAALRIETKGEVVSKVIDGKAPEKMFGGKDFLTAMATETHKGKI